MIDISIYLSSILIDVVTTAVVPSMILELREVSEVAFFIVLNHSRSGLVVAGGTSPRQYHRTAKVDRAGITTINMLISTKKPCTS